MIYFPQNLMPNWVESVSLPARPTISQRFQNGADSDLMLSSIRVDGKIRGEFYLTPTQTLDLRNFWWEVERVASFRFRENFWPVGGNPAMQGLRDYSPTGLWRFDEQPSFDTNLTQDSFVTIIFRGAVL